MTWVRFGAGELRGLAPEQFGAFDVVVDRVGSAVPSRMAELSRRRVTLLLGGDRDALPALDRLAEADIEALASWPTSLQYDAVDRAVLELTEQFVIDVSSITDEQRARCLGDLGDQAFGMVQVLYVLDHGLRVRAALRQLFGVPVATRPPAPPPAPGTDLWAALDEWMRSVARRSALDPLTTELVRLRGARVHDCRLCRSLRSVRAVRSGAVPSGEAEELFDQIDRYESSALSERHKVALRLTDAILVRPTAFPPGLVEQVRERLDPSEALEIVWDVARNAANKIAVTFRADEPHVAQGVEFFDVDARGELVYGLSPGRQD